MQNSDQNSFPFLSGLKIGRMLACLVSRFMKDVLVLTLQNSRAIDPANTVLRARDPTGSERGTRPLPLHTHRGSDSRVTCAQRVACLGCGVWRSALSDGYRLTSTLNSPTLQVDAAAARTLRGYFAHNKKYPLLGPYYRPMPVGPRVLWWFCGSGIFA
jgi:hypothetical protein